MKNNKSGFAAIFGIIIVLVLLGGSVYLYQQKVPVVPAPVVCTMEAKLCPDGSSVGRTGPNCEFAACPGASPAPVVDNSFTTKPATTSAVQLETTTGLSRFSIEISDNDLPAQPLRFPAHVTVYNQDGVVLSSVDIQGGHLAFVDIPSGSYSVLVTSPGFKDGRKSFTVKPGATEFHTDVGMSRK